MSCCGQKREALRAGSAYARSQQNLHSIPSPAVQTPQQAVTDGVVLRYLGHGAISLRGPYSGGVYYFDETGNGTIVHETDVDALLRTWLFARVNR